MQAVGDRQDPGIEIGSTTRPPGLPVRSPTRFSRRKGQDRLSRIARQQLQQHVRNRLRLMLISASQ
jgi:hypothetical protein